MQLRLLGLAVVVGIIAAASGAVFLALVGGVQRLLFVSLPDAVGWERIPWWWIALLLLLAAAVVALAQRLPGATGKGPLTGFHFDTPLRSVPSVLLAAFGTLALGITLGPEAPLIVVGSTVGALLVRRSGPSDTMRVAMFLGGTAAIGAVFGNPFVVAFIILEFIAFGLAPRVLLVPALLALASGYLTQVGLFGIPGFGNHSLAVPGLPAYNAIGFGNLGLGLAVAIVAGLIAIAVRQTAGRIDATATRRPVPVLFIGAGVTAAVAVIAYEFADVPLDLVLFSGNSGMGGLVAETSIGIVALILVAKAVAYTFALGSGFRGGPIFPATYLGVAVAVLASLLVSEVPVTPLVAAGIAASAAAMTRLAATGALLGALLVAGSGAAVAPFAIIGGIVGFLIRMAVEARSAKTPVKESA